MKKGVLFLLTFVLTAFCFITGVSADTTLPIKDGENKITLTADVDLATTYVSSETDLTIDLAGFKIIGPENGYAINVTSGKLTIIDSKNNQGTGLITCSAANSSCVRNASTLKIENAKVHSDGFIAVKNEENSTLDIDNSEITSGSVAIENYGTATVKNSIIESTSSESAAIYAFVYEDNASSISIEKSTITSPKSAIKTAGISSTDSANGTLSIRINEGTVIISDDPVIGIANPVIGGYNVAEVKEPTIEANGSITAPASIVQYAKSGAKVTVNTLLENFTIPDGVTVSTLNGNKLHKNDDGTYSVVKAEDVATTTQAAQKNPNTVDGSALYFVMAFAGLALTLITARSLIKHH